MNQPKKTSYCPQCGHRLATGRAQQCLACGLCWHGRPRPATHAPSACSDSTQNDNQRS